MHETENLSIALMYGYVDGCKLALSNNNKLSTRPSIEKWEKKLLASQQFLSSSLWCVFVKTKQR